MAQESYNVRPADSTGSSGLRAIIAIIAVLFIGYLLFASNRTADDGIGKQNNMAIEEYMTSEAAQVEPTPTPTPTPETVPTPTQ